MSYLLASFILCSDVAGVDAFTVDAHTADHIYKKCLQGELMRGRTIILVSHHVQLCAQGAKYIVALDNGRVQFEGDQKAFYASGVLAGLQQSGLTTAQAEKEEAEASLVQQVEKLLDPATESETTAAETDKAEPKAARKLIEEEKRSVGRIGKEVWAAYLNACGKYGYWVLFVLVFVLSTAGPFGEKGWIT